MTQPATARLGLYADLEGRSLRSVGVGECLASGDPGERLVTYSLGSCVGVTLYDPVARVGGMAHCLLPDSSANPADAQARPARYADTGIASLVRAVLSLGARPGRLEARLAGASHDGGVRDVFQIGEQNGCAARKSLGRAGVRRVSDRLGGSVPQTLVLDIDTGRVFVQTPGGRDVFTGH